MSTISKARYPLVVVIGVLLAFVLVACGADDEDEPAAAPAPAAAPDPAPAAPAAAPAPAPAPAPAAAPAQAPSLIKPAPAPAAPAAPGGSADHPGYLLYQGTAGKHVLGGQPPHVDCSDHTGGRLRGVAIRGSSPHQVLRVAYVGPTCTRWEASPAG